MPRLRTKTNKRLLGAKVAVRTPRSGGGRKRKTFKVRSLPVKAQTAVRRAAESLWEVDVKPHELLQELREVILLRCLEEAEGNYTLAAELFGPSRQSVQQYASSPLRDSRWKPYQKSKRRRRNEA